MIFKWKKHIRYIGWWFRPWTRLKQAEQRADSYQRRLKEQGRTMHDMQRALTRKKEELIRLGFAHAKALNELQLMRCAKVKHVNKPSADKAAARLFNQTSHVMESYECYVCPVNPDTGNKWWHIRHTVRSQRGKHGLQAEQNN